MCHRWRRLRDANEVDKERRSSAEITGGRLSALDGFPCCSHAGRKGRSGAGWWLMSGQQGLSAALVPACAQACTLALQPCNPPARQPEWLFSSSLCFFDMSIRSAAPMFYFVNVGREHPGPLATDCLHLSNEALAPASLACPEPSRPSREATGAQLGRSLSCGVISTVPAFLSHGSHSCKVNFSHL